MDLMSKVNEAIAKKETALPKVELQANKTYRAKLTSNIKLRRNGYTKALELQFSFRVIGDSSADFDGGFIQKEIEVGDFNRALIRKDGTTVEDKNGNPVTLGDVAATAFVKIGLTPPQIETLVSEVEAFTSTVDAMGEDAWRGVAIGAGLKDELKASDNVLKLKTAAYGKNKKLGIKEIF